MLRLVNMRVRVWLEGWITTPLVWLGSREPGSSTIGTSKHLVAAHSPVVCSQVLNFKKRYGAAPCSHMDQRWARPERFVVSTSRLLLLKGLVPCNSVSQLLPQG